MEHRFETFTTLIWQISRSIQRIKSAEMEEFQLKGIHAVCLFYLGQAPDGLTQAELAKSCREDKARVSRALVELFRRGLVTDTQSDQAKKYNALLTLTPEGRALADRVEKKVARALDIGGAGFEESDREALYRYLQQINRNLLQYQAEDCTEGKEPFYGY